MTDTDPTPAPAPPLTPEQKAELKARLAAQAIEHARLDALIAYPREHLLADAERGDGAAAARADELYENWRDRK